MRVSCLPHLLWLRWRLGWAGLASQLSGWLRVTQLHLYEQTAVAQQGGQRGAGPP